MTVLGQPFERLFDARLDELGRFVPFRPPDQRALTVAGSGRLLFAQATPPAPASSAKEQQAAQAGRPLPAPLAALSGGDPALDRQIERAARLVNASVGILLTGETGGGKESYAKALHESSGRYARRFVAVNCAAIPESLIESELFSHLLASCRHRSRQQGPARSGPGSRLRHAVPRRDVPRVGWRHAARHAGALAAGAGRAREVPPIGATRPVPVNLRVIAEPRTATR